jgi:8-oxo-dGTP pyrophosphatase MutT (NUDIX family)
MTENARVVAIDQLELSFVRKPWPFAEQRRAEIATHFAERQRRTPEIWNGRVLVLNEYAIQGQVFRGSYGETDYASFLACIDWGWPDGNSWDCFSQGALRSADGAFLLGEMSRQTANAGQIYFPAGTPDPRDIAGSRVDLEASVWREVEEETGLTGGDLVAEPGWHTVLAGRRIAHIKTLQAREDADALRARIMANLSRQQSPELSDIRIVRGPADFDPRMNDYVIAFMSHAWRR